MFKKLLATLVLTAAAATAQAEFRFIVPQEPGGGTSVWATIIARHLERHLGEKIVVQHIPGARDIPGFNEFHNRLRTDPRVIMVSHGGNAESFLGEAIDYNYRDYTPIGGMNLSIVTAYRADFDPRSDKQKIRFSAGSGNNPDVMAFTLLLCGDLPTMADYKKCFDERVVYVKGMKAPERRLAFLRGELNVTRETTAAFIKHVQPLIDKGEVRLWFSHGVLDLRNGRVMIDANYPQVGSFQSVYRARWGREPRGPLYDSYLLVKQYRDVLQKALWVNKGNPNTERLRRALRAMLNDDEAQAEIERDSGRYAWMVGEELTRAVDILQTHVTEQALRDFVWWQREALGVEAIYKPELVQRR